MNAKVNLQNAIADALAPILEKIDGNAVKVADGKNAADSAKTASDSVFSLFRDAAQAVAETCEEYGIDDADVIGLKFARLVEDRYSKEGTPKTVKNYAVTVGKFTRTKVLTGETSWSAFQAMPVKDVREALNPKTDERAKRDKLAAQIRKDVGLLVKKADAKGWEAVEQMAATLNAQAEALRTKAKADKAAAENAKAAKIADLQQQQPSEPTTIETVKAPATGTDG